MQACLGCFSFADSYPGASILGRLMAGTSRKDDRS